MKIYFLIGISITLITTPVLGSCTISEMTNGLFDVVINQNERISMDLRSGPPTKLLQDVGRIESAYIDNRRARKPSNPDGLILNLMGDVACFFYQPDAEEGDRLMSPLFQYRLDYVGIEPLQLESPFLAKYLICFFSAYNLVFPTEDVVLLLVYDSSDPPKLLRLKRNSDERSWSETNRFTQRTFGETIRNIFSDRNIGTPLPETIGKAALLWPQRDGITCYFVRLDRQSPSRPFTPQSPLLTPTEDVIEISCEEG